MLAAKQQPKALPFLFLTEMWERFGFYVVQGMLVLYMSKSFGFSDDKCYTIQGLFTGLSFISPIVGGFLADRVLGFKNAILWGGIFLSVGYAMLALPWPLNSAPSVFPFTLSTINLFYLSLATIIVGNGLFKPNISSLLGSLYELGDPNRESGFTIFYIGINLGGLLAGFSSGYIKNHFGWHAGFALSCIGLLFGLCIFTFGLKKFAQLKNNPLTAHAKIQLPAKAGLVVCCILAIFPITFLLQSHLLAAYFFPILGIGLLSFLLFLSWRQKPPYRQNLLTLYVLILSSIVFWMFMLQLFFSANLFVERLVEKTWFGLTIPTTAFYTLEALFIILLGPLFAWSWNTLSKNKKNPSPFLKFVSAIIFAGLGFLILAISTYFPSATQTINPLWIVFSYLAITIGEMLLSPIGLSAVTTLTPRHLVGTMMGVWFVALGFGGQFAGWLAKLSDIPDTIKDLGAQLLIYRQAFFIYAIIAALVATTLFIIHLFLKRILGADGLA